MALDRLLNAAKISTRSAESGVGQSSINMFSYVVRRKLLDQWGASHWVPWISLFGSLLYHSQLTYDLVTGCDSVSHILDPNNANQRRREAVSVAFALLRECEQNEHLT